MTSTPSWPADNAGGVLGDGRFATATFAPASVDELRSIVRDAVASGLAIYPQGGRTALDYGGVPGRPGVAVGTGRLDRVIDYPVADMTITVEAGMTLAAVRMLVGAKGQRLAIECSQPDRATLGGIFATASTGPRRFGWGRPRDAIIGVAFVTGDGELVRGGGRVVKNVAGYDFPKLLTGSCGTLGIITELTLKVNPRTEASALVRLEYDSLAEVGSALAALNVSGTRPIALELVDGITAGLDSGTKWALLVGLEGNGAAVDWQIHRLSTETGQTSASVPRDKDSETAWLDFVAVEAEKSASISFRASFAPSAALQYLEGIDVRRWTVRVHAGNGVVRGAARSASDDLSAWEMEVKRLRVEANRLGGSLILSKCPTEWKARLHVWGDRRPEWTIAESVKHALDPAHVLNPGRFVGTI